MGVDVVYVNLLIVGPPCMHLLGLQVLSALHMIAHNDCMYVGKCATTVILLWALSSTATTYLRIWIVRDIGQNQNSNDHKMVCKHL